MTSTGSYEYIVPRFRKHAPGREVAYGFASASVECGSRTDRFLWRAEASAESYSDPMPSTSELSGPGLLATVFGDLKQFRRNLLQPSRDAAEVDRWRKAKRPVPPPEAVKRETLLAYAKAFQIETLVETGTFLGGTMYALRDNFEILYSIELSYELVKRARHRFRKMPQIHILEGDSGSVLAELAPRLKSRCLFYLDGHFSAGITAHGSLDTPILSELRTIFSQAADHVVVIDDARLFDGTNDYPTLEQVQMLFARERPAINFPC